MSARPDLFHYSDAPLRAVRSVKQPAEQPNGYISVFGKPNGLWLSVDGDDDWPSWCESADFARASLTYRHRIVLRDPEALLWLTTSAALLALTEEFGVDVTLGGSYYGRVIDWSAVARSWDCASGCIWNASAVAAVEIAPARQVEAA